MQKIFPCLDIKKIFSPSLNGQQETIFSDGKSFAMIKPWDCLEVGVKNDEHLIKMVAVVQRLLTGGGGGSDSGALTEEEFEQLQQAAEDISKSLEKKEEEK